MRGLRTPLHGSDHLPDGPDPIPTLGNGLQGSWGQLFNDGSIIDPGSGDWSAVWDSVNGYTITFDSAFASPPTVLLTANNNNAAGGSTPAAYFAQLLSRTTTEIVVVTYALDGSPADGGFDFLAINPPA